MNQTVTQSKFFNSDELTECKYNQLYNFALQLRNHKQNISIEFNKNVEYYLEMGKFGFITYMRKKFPGLISGYFDGSLYGQIFDSYKNRYEQFVSKIKFVYRKFQEFQLYKKDCKSGKKGTLNYIKYKNKTTDLSQTLTYLAKCDKPLDINYLVNKLQNPNTLNKHQIQKYNSIIKCINKFGYERLWNLAQRKRNRILSQYKEPINFTSLTFDGEVKRKTCILRNKNHRSKISTFASITIPINNKLAIIDIPIKYSSKYHGPRTNYFKKPNKSGCCSYFYKIMFDEYNKEVIFQYCLTNVQKEIPCNKTNFVGVDVNVKNNLFALSDGSVYDYDRKLISDYIDELNKVDKLKKQAKLQKTPYQVSRKRQHMLNKFQDSIKHMNERLISDVCKDLVTKGFDHVVLENLDNSFSKSYVKNNEFDEKYNRLNHILRIGSIKEQFKSIALKYGISVSFVQAEYTSQLCPICGSIHKENRLNQEEFCCCECGYSANADFNAASNIKNRVEQTVFANSLLNKQSDGSYLPKNLTHEQVCDKIHKGVIQLLKQKSYKT